MSKINAVRLINVNYNNNAYRISDETLHFNGKSTLISLQNGGGEYVFFLIVAEGRTAVGNLFLSRC